MSVAGLNTVFNNTTNSGIMRILYDFSLLQTSSQAPFKGFASIANSKELNSGILISKTSGIYSPTSEDLAYNGGSGLKLYGGISGHEQFVYIDGSEQIFTGQPFTLFFDAEKLGISDFGISETGSVHDREILLSSVSGDYGFELGLNTANRLFVRTLDGDQYKTLTLNNIPYGRNIWFMSYQPRNLTLGWFDPALQSVYAESLTLVEDLSAGGSWNIGSGIGCEALYDGVEGSTASVQVNRFAMFDHCFSASDMALIARASMSDASASSSTETGVYNQLTGLSLTCVDVTGVIFASGDLVASSTGTVYVTGEPVYSELTGWVAAGEDYFVREGDVFLTETNYSDSPITGIIGFGWTSPVSSETVVTYEYSNQDVTGIISSACYLTEINEPVTGLLSQSITGTSGYDGSELWPDSLSFLGPELPTGESFCEILMGVPSYSGINQVTNVLALKAGSNFGTNKTIFLSNPRLSFHPSSGRLFVNGLYQRYGDVTLSSGAVSGTLEYTVELDRDYGLVGREIVLSLPFDTSERINNLLGVFDLQQASGFQQLVVSSTSQYTGVLGISPSGASIFFNGQKIYQNSEYQVSGTGILATGYIAGCTGTWVAVPEFDYSSRVTGDSIWGHYGEKFEPKSPIVFINGVRAGYDKMVDHSKPKDLLAGIGVDIDDLLVVAKGSF